VNLGWAWSSASSRACPILKETPKSLQKKLPPRVYHSNILINFTKSNPQPTLCNSFSYPQGKKYQ
jgi:hypothetical protein